MHRDDNKQQYELDHGMQLDRPLYQQPVRSQGIEIEKDVWLGAHVGIKDGIKIGKHAVVGMNSMVTKDVEPYHIVGGNPAKFIRLRE
ncbi:acyltransferase, partial [Acinetobacter baumannii]